MALEYLCDVKIEYMYLPSCFKGGSIIVFVKVIIQHHDKIFDVNKLYLTK